MMLWKRVVGLVAVVWVAAGACSALTGDGSDNVFARAAVPASEARLDDAVLAFHVGPANDEMFTPLGRVHKPGFLVLVAQDGSIRTIRTAAMDQATLAWSSHGLYFSDENTDYVLDQDGLTGFRNPKAPGQNLNFALRDGGAIGVYNKGGTEGGYLNQVTVTTDTGSRLYDVQGNYFNGADCDGQIFGLSGDPGSHLSASASIPGMSSKADPGASPQMLARLYPPSPTGAEELVAWRPSFDAVVVPGQLPCHRDKIIFLSWDRDADGSQHPRVVTWNTRTGHYRHRPLTFPDNTKLSFEPFGLSSYGPHSLRDDHLDWIYADGRVFSTNIATGRTTELFTTNLPRQIGGTTKPYFAFTPTKIHALNQLYESPGDLTYLTFDRTTGTPTTTPLPIPNTNLNRSHLNLWRITPHPTP
ncbi:hypothetical protein [Actinocorallia sp. A-T 12471]|uniref:hypothetical protein n=1 Tax=Actinocorallia sp. A-T 12471 TaxID=3089813 RepID=UPI0029D18283|nr:hypothetical protein [Actinocorallia sp. A-T 12471]MDX6738548.1 hypothetical protein [Actinocorallia sp. A-T 12471]